MKLPAPGSPPPISVAEPEGPTLVERFRALSPEVEELQGRRAGLVTRSIAFTLDFLVVIIGYPLIMWGWGIFIGLIHFSPPTYPDFPRGVSLAISMTWNFVYFVGSWYLAGRTVGMAVMGIRVVGWRRRRLGLVQSSIRYVVLFATLAVAPVWLFFARSRLALHDRFARTQVVYARREKRTTVRLDVGAAPQRGSDDVATTGGRRAS